VLAPADEYALNMAFYPFDDQLCTMELETWVYTCDKRTDRPRRVCSNRPRLGSTRGTDRRIDRQTDHAVSVAIGRVLGLHVGQGEPDERPLADRRRQLRAARRVDHHQNSHLQHEQGRRLRHSLLTYTRASHSAGR